MSITCTVCRDPFAGKKGARTYSSTCRKRLQRLKQSVLSEFADEKGAIPAVAARPVPKLRASLNTGKPLSERVDTVVKHRNKTKSVYGNDAGS